MKRIVRTTALSLLVCALVSSAVPAIAAPPNSQPRVLRSVGFEAGESGWSSEPTVVGAEPVNAIWGPSSGVAHTGTTSLWCAGLNYPALTPSTAWPKYPSYTRGRVWWRMPEMADYYATRVSYWYTMPSKGADDSFGVGAAQMDSQGTPVLNTGVNDSGIGLSSGWTKKSYDLGSTVSRTPVVCVMSFFYGIQSAVGGDVRGQGPSVDDFVVSGFKFGPARSATARWITSPATGVRLDWVKPATSASVDSSDTRGLAYRVWRSESGRDTWTEITGSRIAETTILDSSAVAGHAYDYSVQAWDTASGTEYGVPTVIAFATPGAKISVKLSSLSGVPSSVKLGNSFTVSGKLTPAHTTGTPVKIYAYRYKGTRKVETRIFSARITNVGQPSGTTKFTANIRLPRKGNWKLRARHAGTDTEKSAWSTYSRTVAVK